MPRTAPAAAWRFSFPRSPLCPPTPGLYPATPHGAGLRALDVTDPWHFWLWFSVPLLQPATPSFQLPLRHCPNSSHSEHYFFHPHLMSNNRPPCFWVCITAPRRLVPPTLSQASCHTAPAVRLLWIRYAQPPHDHCLPRPELGLRGCCTPYLIPILDSESFRYKTAENKPLEHIFHTKQ